MIRMTNKIFTYELILLDAVEEISSCIIRVLTSKHISLFGSKILYTLISLKRNDIQCITTTDY